MDRHELLILAASQIAGGIADRAYGPQMGSVPQMAAADHVATLSLHIARKIMEEAAKHPGA